MTSGTGGTSSRGAAIPCDFGLRRLDPRSRAEMEAVGAA